MHRTHRISKDRYEYKKRQKRKEGTTYQLAGAPMIVGATKMRRDEHATSLAGKFTA
jgi:hypothetical protein